MWASLFLSTLVLQQRSAGMQNNGGSSGAALGNQENRQAFLTFGDASWGSIKVR
jgi:hypothetical protein